MPPSSPPSAGKQCAEAITKTLSEAVPPLCLHPIITALAGDGHGSLSLMAAVHEAMTGGALRKRQGSSWGLPVLEGH